MKRRFFVSRLLSTSVSAALLTSPLHAATAVPALITRDHAQRVYRHLLEAHWVPDTGLFLSFPDSQDRKLSQQASVYEQGAVGLLALRMGDVPRARTLFSFLKNTWAAEPGRPERGGARGLSNFYNAYFGAGGIEKTVHAGPNAWAGLFAARLANQTHDAEALQWALDVAYWMANSLPHVDGAIAMGAHDEPRGAPWSKIISTENNVSYYAMLSELLRSTALDSSQRRTVANERANVESWLLTKAFDPATDRVFRGFNPQGSDPMEALDTTTWYLSALGPAKLAEHGIDPDRLMAHAVKTFEVTVDGKIGVDSTDQLEATFIYMNLRCAQGGPARPVSDHHRLIWYEGLGQYILALATMSDYLAQKGDTPGAAAYLAKAKALTDAFDRAALTQYDRGTAFPYASPGKFFRDGWETQAQGANGAASSLIAATWRVFAGLGWDPLAGRGVHSVRMVAVSVPPAREIARAKPPVLFGSSEQMVVNAWQALKNDQLDVAIEQATATISEWSTWASKLEARKAREIGHLVSYDGTPRQSKMIFDYWALNDVGAAYYILGKAYDAKGDYHSASRALAAVVKQYPLAQVWDPQGWFWAPSEAVQSDFIQRDPAHYSDLS